MLKQLALGIILVLLGIVLGQQGRRPFFDFDFIFAWYGILLILDALAQKTGKTSIFKPLNNFLLLAMVSGSFWWFYEWANLYLKNWDYPTMLRLYNNLEFGVIATVCFSTVLPFLTLTSNLVSTAVFKNRHVWLNGTITKTLALVFISIGVLSLFLTVFIPLYFFPIIWFSLFLLFDPINALQGNRSLIIQLLKRNFRIFIILGIAAILAGLTWESINYLLPKWVYPIVPWFWTLPTPFTTKFAEMPLLGFGGYIPFVWSAFALMEYLGINKILTDKKS